MNKDKLTLDAKIESLLFWRGESLSFSKLAKILEKPEDEIRVAVAELETKLSDRGIMLIIKEDEVMLGTSPEMSPVIETLTREDLARDLGKAGLETLAIILYRGPVSRREIDYIRGVNSQFILRNLLIRGLVERVQSPNDQRSFLYKTTFELLAHLGISSIDKLPEYAEMKTEMEKNAEKPEESQEKTAEGLEKKEGNE